MTDHLPECPMLDERYPKHPLENCDYCNMLRACEQRVLESAEQYIKAHMEGKRVGFSLGVQAARDAVAAAQEQAGEINFCKDCADWSVAAIDALRGES